jgi:hypothetical protein
MSRNSIDGERQLLERIIMRLILLAALCDRVAWEAAPVRRLVLSILRPGEAIASEFALGMAWYLGFGPPLETGIEEDIPMHRDSPHDAMMLAMRFRALAVMLQFLAGLVPSGAGKDRSAEHSGSTLAYAEGFGLFVVDMRASTAARRKLMTPDTS